MLGNLSIVAASSVMSALKLELVGPSGVKQLGLLEQGEVLIGRDPDANGIKVDNTAVSRNHGVFLQQGRYWFYKDLGSTNGSWVNGVVAKKDQIKLIRPGTTVQVADSIVKVGAAQSYSSNFAAPGDAETSSTRALVVLSDDQYFTDFTVTEYGRSLVVGGSQGDLILDGDIFELPSIIVERRGDRICAYRIVKDMEASINGLPFIDTVQLNDNDCISIGKYKIIFSDPQANERENATEATSMREGGWSETSATPSLTGGGSQRTGRSTFGQFGVVDEYSTNDTVAIDPEEMQGRLGRDVHPSMRYSVPPQSSVFHIESFEDKILIIVGLVLFLALLGVVVWWFWA